MAKRALVIGIGGMRGAYDAGVAAALCRALGPNYFDGIYASSAGVYAGTLFAANQPDLLEDVWRNNLDGLKFVNFLNLLRGQPILRLDYLTELLLHEGTLLHSERLSQARARLTYVLTNEGTGKPAYVCPTSENVFTLLNASCAMPLLHQPVIVQGTAYIDGGLSDPLPFTKALADGCSEVVVVYNKPRRFLVGERYERTTNIMAALMPKTTGNLIKTLKSKYLDIEQDLQHSDNQHSIKTIRPKVQLPLKSILDTNKVRLNACVDMGIADAKEFLKTYHD